MSKEIIWRNVDSVWFEVDLFKIKNFDNLFDEVIEQETEEHYLNDTFTFGSVREAIFTAESLLTRDDDYNYATIWLKRYNDDPCASMSTNSEGIVDETILIGDICSEEVSDESNSEG